jgi:ATP adenylyltransferase
MDHLFSPWRLAYVTGASGPTTGCIFCEATGPTANPERSRLVIAEGRVSFAILNLYPYNNGHLMIATKRHVPSLAAATPEELDELMRFTRDAEIVLTEAYTPQGLNIGINLGRPAGAGVVDHVHVHLVPRWNGDTSFMSVVGETRVLPETFDDTAKRLRPIFERVTRQTR